MASLTTNEQAKQHTISMTVENHFGTLNRVAGLFAAKGYNIDSLTVGPTEDDAVSRMTIVTRGDDQIIEQIRVDPDQVADAESALKAVRNRLLIVSQGG